MHEMIQAIQIIFFIKCDWQIGSTISFIYQKEMRLLNLTNFLFITENYSRLRLFQHLSKVLFHLFFQHFRTSENCNSFSWMRFEQVEKHQEHYQSFALSSPDLSCNTLSLSAQKQSSICCLHVILTITTTILRSLWSQFVFDNGI